MPDSHTQPYSSEKLVYATATKLGILDKIGGFDSSKLSLFDRGLLVGSIGELGEESGLGGQEAIQLLESKGLDIVGMLSGVLETETMHYEENINGEELEGYQVLRTALDDIANHVRGLWADPVKFKEDDERARKILDFFEEWLQRDDTADGLNRLGGALYLVGSMLFGDPVFYDLDTKHFSLQPAAGYQKVEEALDSSLDEAWTEGGIGANSDDTRPDAAPEFMVYSVEDTSGGSVVVGYDQSMQKIDKYVVRQSKGDDMSQEERREMYLDIEGFINGRDEYIPVSDYFDALTVPLTGKVVYEAEEGVADAIATRVKEKLTKNKYRTFFAVLGMAKVAVERHKRRLNDKAA